MKKRILLVLLAVVMLFVLSSCVCEHQWLEANCLTPKTCSLCEETEGEPLGHDWLAAECTLPERCSRCEETVGEALGHIWVDADCVTPKTCSVCAETEGEALGHTWADATCVTPKTCSVCAETEGEALGHTWVDADCVTPKTCSVCAETEGEALGHTWADATCVTAKTCSVCAKTEGEALGHTFVEATCTAPETCSVCGETQGEPLPHSFGRWAVNEDVMTHTCTVCQTEETTAVDYDAYLEEALAGEWIVVWGVHEGTVYPLRAGINQQYVAVYLNFQEGKKVQFFSEFTDPNQWDCTWEMMPESLEDDYPSYAIRITSEHGEYIFEYDGNTESMMTPGIDPFSVCIMLRNRNEPVAKGLSQGVWYAVDEARKVSMIHFAEDYTFNGYLDGEEVIGRWHLRDAYETDYGSYEGDIVVTYQNDGMVCVLPLNVYYGDMDTANPYSMNCFDYSKDLMFEMRDDERDIAELQQDLANVEQLLVGEWRSVQLNDLTGETTVRSSNLDCVITLSEDGTFIVNDAFAAYADGITDGTWEINYLTVGYQDSVMLSIRLKSSNGEDDMYGHLYDGLLGISMGSYSMEFNMLSQEQLEAMEKALDEAEAELCGTWTSLGTFTFSGNEQMGHFTTEYQIILAEDKTVTLNAALAEATGLSATGKWEVASVGSDDYGSTEYNLSMTFDGNRMVSSGLYYGELYLYDDVLTYTFEQLTPENLEMLAQGEEKLVGNWVSIRTEYKEEITETNEYSLTIAPDGTFTVNEALSDILACTSGRWWLDGYDAMYGYTYLLTCGDGSRSRSFTLTAEGELYFWHSLGEDYQDVYFTME